MKTVGSTSDTTCRREHRSLDGFELGRDDNEHLEAGSTSAFARAAPQRIKRAEKILRMEIIAPLCIASRLFYQLASTKARF